MRSTECQAKGSIVPKDATRNMYLHLGVPPRRLVRTNKGYEAEILPFPASLGNGLSQHHGQSRLLWPSLTFSTRHSSIRTLAKLGMEMAGVCRYLAGRDACIASGIRCCSLQCHVGQEPPNTPLGLTAARERNRFRPSKLGQV
jgi:hypothetical protein